MDVGVMIFPVDDGIDPRVLARAVEERGFESLWFPEHSHIPVSRRTPWGGPQRIDAPALPREYWRTYDSFVSLSMAAAVTTTLKVATGICLVAQRDPLWTAKEVASLDRLSGGRFLFGIGYGWNVEEMASHGLAFNDRRDILREHVLAMKALWTRDEASFEGAHVHLEPSWAWPKPTQQPHPPVILGGAAGPRTIDHIVEFCDGWMPIAGRHPLGDNLHLLRRRAEEAGRDPATIQLGLFGAKADPESLDALARQGFTRAVFGLPPADESTVLEVLDRHTKVLEAMAA
jgi:probable F420-dependent oxidoreductase